MFESNLIEEATLLELLKQVIDPEIGINIVDLGLIHTLKIDLINKKIKIEMVFTTPSCPMQEIITAEMNALLQNSYPNFELKTIPMWYPLWTADRISPEGKIILKIV